MFENNYVREGAYYGLIFGLITGIIFGIVAFVMMPASLDAINVGAFFAKFIMWTGIGTVAGIATGALFGYFMPKR